MALFTVNNADDAGAGSLRQAIIDANGTPEPDVIEFASGFSITLSTGELVITAPLVIDGDIDDDGTPDVTVDADGASRVFNVTDPTAGTTLEGLTITGGMTSADNASATDFTHSGGGVRSVAALTLTNSVVTGNATMGLYAQGGGVFGESMITLDGTTISGNTTSGDYAAGGGLFGYGSVEARGSTISGNSTSGYYADAGGIYGYTLTLVSSTVSGNATAGDFAFGGGALGETVTLVGTTVSGNATRGDIAIGGGVAAADLTLVNATLSGNSTAGFGAQGGGAYAETATVIQSTITGNSTAAFAAEGGGIYGGSITLTNSLVLGNASAYAGVGGDDLYQPLGPPSFVGGNIVGGTRYAGMAVAETGILPGAVFSSVVDLIADSNGDGVLDGSDVVVASGGAGALGSNGGPVSTVALLGSPTNPAFDRGTGPLPMDDFDLDGDTDTAEALPVDATGAPRAIDALGGGAIPDLGAVEGEVEAPAETNLPPTALTLGEIAVPEDGPPVVADLSDRVFDPDGDPLSLVSLGLLGTDGAASIGPGPLDVTYDPAGAFESLGQGETAIDRLLFTVADPDGETATARLDVTILGANDPPTANPDFGAVDADAGQVLLFLTFNDTDPDTNDDLEVASIDTDGTVGAVEILVGAEGVSYTPSGFGGLAPGETAEDVFTYTVTDRNGGTASASVTVTVTGTEGSTDENEPPAAADDAFEVVKTAGPVFFDILANDTDPNGDPLEIVSLTPVGAVDGLFMLTGDGRLRYDAEGQFPGLAAGETTVETFDYTIADGRGGTDTARVAITVLGAGPGAGGGGSDAPPIARDDRLAAEAGAGAVPADLFADNGFGPDRDPEGLAITLVGLAGGAPGTVMLPSGAMVTAAADGSATYDPGSAFDALAPGETAEDSFTYRIADPGGQTDQATVTVTVMGAPFDVIEGTDEDDVFTVESFARATEFTGGPGADTVVLPGALTDYLICPDGDGILFEPVDETGMRAGQPVRVTGIERIEIGGEVLVLDESPEAKAIFDMFQVFLGRKGQPAGIDFYADFLDIGRSIDDVAEAFPNAPEWIAVNGAPGEALDPDEAVDILFENGLGRPAASDFWSSFIADGLLTVAEVGIAIFSSAEYQDRFGDITESGVFRLADQPDIA